MNGEWSNNWREIYLGAAYDAMRVLNEGNESFFMHIKPLAGYTGIVYGPALTTYGETVKCRETNDWAPMTFTKFAPPYEDFDKIRYDIYDPKYFTEHPIVCLEARDRWCAHSGDITSMIYQKLGAVGFVTDGNIRDTEKINKLGFPCFAKNSNAIDAINYWAIVKFNCPITVDGVTVHPGDIIIGAADGVVRVPMAKRWQFEEQLAKILEKENSVREIIRKSDNPNIKQLAKRFGRW